MTRRPRYILLTLGIIFFVFAAPTLVFYVQGKLPVLGNRRMQPTGIISVTSDPSGASVYVDGVLEDTTPAAVRFLPTGDYTVQIHKNGYWDWQKRLPVVAGHVTYTNPNPEKQILLKREDPQELTAMAELYAPFKKGVIYTHDKTLFILASIEEPEKTVQVPLPETPTELITTTASSFIVARTAHSLLIINPATSTVTTINKQISADSAITLTDNALIALTPDNTLISIPFNKPTGKTAVLASNVLAFHIRESDIYYVHKDVDNSTLRHASLDTTQLTGDQLLAKNIPDQTATLYIDNTKAVFVLSNKTLYRVNAEAESIATDVTSASDQTGTLSYTTAGELWWYDSISNTGRLVSRSSEGFTNALVQPSLQYALFAQSTKLTALELDDRGEQNRYVLDTQDQLHDLRYLNSTTLTYMAGNSLRYLTIR